MVVCRHINVHQTFFLLLLLTNVEDDNANSQIGNRKSEIRKSETNTGHAAKIKKKNFVRVLRKPSITSPAGANVYDNLRCALTTSDRFSLVNDPQHALLVSVLRVQPTFGLGFYLF